MVACPEGGYRHLMIKQGDFHCNLKPEIPGVQALNLVLDFVG